MYHEALQNFVQKLDTTPVMTSHACKLGKTYISVVNFWEDCSFMPKFVRQWYLIFLCSPL